MTQSALKIMLFRRQGSLNPNTHAPEYQIVRIHWDTPEFRLITVCVRNALALLYHERVQRVLALEAFHTADSPTKLRIVVIS